MASVAGPQRPSVSPTDCTAIEGPAEIQNSGHYPQSIEISLLHLSEMDGPSSKSGDDLLDEIVEKEALKGSVQRTHLQILTLFL